MKKKKTNVLGKQIAYLEAGEGDPIVFQHGNPTSSYMWRNVIPHLEKMGRCIAPDLIGMGDSEKLPPADGPKRYSFPVSYRYLDAFLETIGVTENVTGGGPKKPITVSTSSIKFKSKTLSVTRGCLGLRESSALNI
jgi:haloalkane dehalogenase